MYRCIRKGNELLVFDKAGNPTFKRANEPRRVMDYSTNTMVNLPPDASLECVDYNAKPSICVKFSPQECNAFSDFCQSYNYRGTRRCRRRGTTMKSLSALEKCYQEKEDLMNEITQLKSQGRCAENPDSFMENDSQIAKLTGWVQLMSRQIDQYQQIIADLDKEKIQLLENLRTRPLEVVEQARLMPPEDRSTLVAQINAEKEQLQEALQTALNEQKSSVAELKQARAELQAVQKSLEDSEDQKDQIIQGHEIALKALIDERDSLRLKYDNTQAVVQELKSGATQSEQVCADKVVELNQVKTELAAALQRHEQIEQVMEEISQQKARNDAQLQAELAQVRAELDSKIKQMTDPDFLPKASKYESYKETLQRVNLEYAKLKQEYEVLLAAQKADDFAFQSELTQLQSKQNEFKNIILQRDDELRIVRDELMQAQAKLREFEARLNEYETELAQSRKDLIAAQEQVRQYEQNIRQYEESIAQVMSEVEKNMSPQQLNAFLRAVLPAELRPAEFNENPIAESAAAPVESAAPTAPVEPAPTAAPVEPAPTAAPAAPSAPVEPEPAARGSGRRSGRRRACPKQKMYQDVKYVLSLLEEASKLISKAHRPEAPLKRRRKSGRVVRH